MNWAQAIAELGGYGAIGPLVGGMFSSIFGSLRELIQLNRELALGDTAHEDNAVKEKMAILEQSKFGKGVVWFIIIVALVVLSAGVWVPVMAYCGDFAAELINAFRFNEPINAPTIALVWYFPKEGSFLFFSWDKLHEYAVGPEGARHVIAILPSFISMAANTVSFFLMNRVRKKWF